jgi:hypothetical protein
MDNNPNNQPWHSNKVLVAAVTLAVIIAATGVLLVGWAALKAVTNVLADGLPELGLVVIQTAVTVLGVVASLILAVSVVVLLAVHIIRRANRVLEDITSRMAIMEATHKKQLDQLKGRAPTFVACTAWLGQVALVVVDKSFGEDKFMIVLLSVLFVIAFGFANTLMLRSSWKAWSAGCGAWVLTFLSVPLTITGYYSWNVQELSNNVLQMLSTDRQAVIIVSVIIVSVILFLLVLPIYSLFIFLDRKESIDPADAVPD